MTEVHVEQEDLTDGSELIYKVYPHRIRLAYNPRVISEEAALHRLSQALPEAAGSTITRPTARQDIATG